MTQPADLLTVQARLDLPFAAIELQRVDLPHAIDHELAAIDAYRIDLGLTARTPDARLSFQRHWPAHRFEALGKVYLVPPGEEARARSGAGSQRAVICFLRQATLDGWFDGASPRIGAQLDAGLDIRSITVARLMSQLGEEARAPGFAQAAIAVELGRYYLDREARSPAALSPWRLALIEERLRTARLPPTLDELARLCGLSTRHLTRGFRASRGCSIGGYIREHQIEAAKRALADGECVKAIAHDLGFASRSGFSHAFQRGTGTSPQQYRERIAAERVRRDH